MAGQLTDGMTPYPAGNVTGFETVPFDINPIPAVGASAIQTQALSIAGLAFAITSGAASAGTVSGAFVGTVTLNGQKATLTTPALTIAAGASYVITWTNSSIASSANRIFAQLLNGTCTLVNVFNLQPAATITATTTASGSGTITITNNHPTNPLNGTLVLNAVIL